MKKFIIWTLAALVLMLGFPFLAVQFAGTNGMAVCFILFFLVNPLFSLACGIFSGLDIKRLWVLPVIVPVLFLAGVWLMFDPGEPAFLLYGAIYLGLGIVSMAVSAVIKKVCK